MTIGSYANPEEDVAIPKPEPEGLQDGITSALTSHLEDDKENLEKTVDYKERLKQEGISLAEAQAIVDSVLTGTYEETLSITKTVSVTFRTRLYADYQRYMQALEVVRPQYQSEQDELKSRHFMAASLVSFHGYTLPHPALDAAPQKVEELFQERLAWLSKQSDLVINLLSQKLNQFDRKVLIVLSEGVIENF